MSEQTKHIAKNEKDSRRSSELRLAALEEEISDLKVEKQTLEKVISTVLDFITLYNLSVFHVND